MTALGVTLSDSVSERWQRFIGFGSQGVANGLTRCWRSRSIARRKIPWLPWIFAWTVIPVVWTHNKRHLWPLSRSEPVSLRDQPRRVIVSYKNGRGNPRNKKWAVETSERFSNRPAVYF